MVYGFVHFNDDDPEALVALGDVLIPWVDNHISDLAEGYEIASMTSDDLAESGVGEVSQGDIIGVALGVDYTAGSNETFAEAMVFEQQDEIFSHFVTFEREVLSGGDCFLAHSCDDFLAADELYAEIALGIEFWSDYEIALRWIELEDGRSVLLHQLIGPEPTTSTSSTASASSMTTTPDRRAACRRCGRTASCCPRMRPRAATSPCPSPR